MAKLRNTKIRNLISDVSAFLKDVLLPVFCIECDKEGEWWCEKCQEKLEFLPNSEAVAPLDGVTALFKYNENDNLAKLIQQFKYQYARDIARVWEELIRVAIQKYIIDNNTVFQMPRMVIVPVPLHFRRQRERGFNQAGILADLVLAGLRVFKPDVILCEDKLQRARHTAQQAKLSGEERRKNLLGAFVWNDKSRAPENALLVDDVYTTGATMSECAKILKSAGARTVWGLVLAKG